MFPINKNIIFHHKKYNKNINVIELTKYILKFII